MFDMGIIKIEINLAEATKTIQKFKNNRMRTLENFTNSVKDSVGDVFNQLLKTEMTLFLGDPDQSDNKKNGYDEREYALKGVGCLRIRMPIDRKRRFESGIIPPREQIDPRLREDIAVLHLAGISTRTMAMISKRILGVPVSADTVSKSLKSIEEQALTWLERPLTKDFWALWIDGTNFRIQRRGSTEKEPSLVVLGMDSTNRMSILSIQPGQKDSAECWRSVFMDLKKRGLQADAVRIGIMDGLAGLEKVFKEEFQSAVTARCWVHALKNMLAKAPKRLRDPLKMLARKIMYASSENAARVEFKRLKEAMEPDAQRAVRCLEKDLNSLLTHYRFEKNLWRCLKTTNPIERVNKELKRRTKSMETLGERTLMIITAFTALRLEFNWHKTPADSSNILRLVNVERNEKIQNGEDNAVESSIRLLKN